MRAGQPKSAAERKADERDRYRAAGLVAVTVWIAPSDRERLQRYIKRLNERKVTK